MAKAKKLLTGAALNAINATLIDAANVSRGIFVELAEGIRMVSEGEALQDAASKAELDDRSVLSGVIYKTLTGYGVAKADFTVTKSGARVLATEHPVNAVLAKACSTLSHGLEPGSKAAKKASKHWSVSKGMGVDVMFGALKLNKDGTVAASETAANTKAKANKTVKAQLNADAEARAVAAWVKLQTVPGQPAKGNPFGDGYAVLQKCMADWLPGRADMIAKREKHGKRSK
jgi:hypothetical protein